MSKILFDHMYTADPRHRYLKRLEKCGFHLLESEMRHPGGSVCRFIRFEQPSTPRGRIYLEFIHTSGGHKPKPEPGLSFSTAAPLKKLNARLASSSTYTTDFFHRNYDWQKDEDERRPGWNFLKFTKPKFRGIYPWFTEYEPVPAAKKIPLRPHPNGATRLTGVILEVDPVFEKLLTDLTGKPFAPRLTLACGMNLRLTRAKKTRVDAAIIKCTDLKKFVRNYDYDSLESYDDQPAARIINPSGMWDVLLV